MSRPKPRRGRPPRADKAATKRIELRVTRLERATWAHAAAVDGISVSEWLRRLAEEEITKRNAGWRAAIETPIIKVK